ncbi:MAG TPA: Ig-like domain-containing protein [Candidatus Eisenbacteria bacterium]|nr:Ig-like domain-containing protein [Candidatus Eisenbacteria bacterium]
MNGTSHPDLRIALGLAITIALACVPALAAAAPPVLTVPGAQTVNENELLTFTVSATDPDGQTCDLYASGMPSGATLRDNGNNTGTFSWTPVSSQLGTHVVRFYADDTFGGTDTETVSIEVRNANVAPVLSPIADRSVERGAFLAILAMGSDDDGDALSFRATGMPSFGTLTDNGDGSASLVFTPGPTAPLGGTVITVFLTDGTEEVSTSFQLTVTSSTATAPPVLGAIGNRTVTEGTASSVTLTASDADGDALTWSVSLPGFADLTVTQSGAGTSTARLDLTPGFCDAGTHPATVTVSDGSGSDSEAFTISVLDSNRAPAWQVPAGGFAVSITAGASATRNVSATDPDQACGGPAPVLSVSGSNAGDQLTLSLTSSGNGSGVLHVSAASDATGDFEVTLRASDGASSSSFHETTVAVHVTGTPPLPARAWFEKDPVRLDIGRPRERVFLEPKQASFSVFDVVLASIRLRAWEGAGTVDEIVPVEGRFLFSDRDQNALFDLRMEFGKDDLRALLAHVGNHDGVPLTLTASLRDGREVEATLIHDLVPARERVIRKVGPNPLNPEATIALHMPAGGTLTVRVYDLSGRLVRTIVDRDTRAAGDHEIRFDGKDDRGVTLPSGRYFVRAEVPGGSDSRAITVVK